jgi:hypothetical protein
VAVVAIKQNNQLPELGAALLSAAMALPCVMGVAHAESAPEKGILSFKYLNYKERQQITADASKGYSATYSNSGASAYDDRIRVTATASSVMLPLNSEWSMTATLITDSISGASPAYQTEALTGMKDFRRAVDTSLTHYLPNGTITLGVNHSAENDYVSRGVSLVATQANESKNTTWTAGIGMNRDEINPSNLIVANERKRGLDLIVGVTQVLTMNDIVQFNLGLYTGRGYFSDPYKIYDERPRDRSHQTFQTRWNHHFTELNGTSRWAYRYYSDNWGIRSHTMDAEWVQRLGGGWSVAPAVRYYSQTAAKFYVEVDPTLAPFPTSPPVDARYFSEDQRVSAFGGLTVGMKLVKQLSLDTKVDLKFEQYGQKGVWSLMGSGSKGLVPFYARSLQVGLTHTF